MRSAATLALAVLLIAALAWPRAAFAQCRPQAFRVVVDVGHSLDAPGATSARGRPEFAFNQELARRVAALLRRDGITGLKLVNEAGQPMSLSERVAAINALTPDVLISIHHDAVQPQFLKEWTVEGQPQSYTEHARGFSLFISNANPHPQASRQLAGWLGDAFTDAGLAPTLHHAEPIPGENRPLLDEERGIYAFDGLAVLRGSTAPAVLLEAAVIKHRDDEALARSPAFQQSVADAVLTAVRTACAMPGFAATPR
jgi:N-acetylmuramoyl-L-alanine amidase